jgi:hypothetical protein
MFDDAKEIETDHDDFFVKMIPWAGRRSKVGRPGIDKSFWLVRDLIQAVYLRQSNELSSSTDLIAH